MQAQLKDADPQMAPQQLESWKAYKKGFQEGIALFNQKPKKGVAFLQVSHSPSAQRIAPIHNVRISCTQQSDIHHHSNVLSHYVTPQAY